MDSLNITPSIFDSNGLAAIKRQVKSNDPAALKAAAQQFEALFLQIVLKSMRDATPKGGLFDSEQSRMYESLLDQQMSQVLAANGGTGLARLIESQLSRDADADAASASSPVKDGSPAGMQIVAPASSSSAHDFVDRMMPLAIEASRSSGIPAHFIVAQAALETGWGRSEPRYPNGQPSHNLFGIKAGGNWTGPTVDASTTEYVGGVARQRVERFRAYSSYAEAFEDYANLIAGNSRYSAVVGRSDPVEFAQGLARAGYATDPAYAEKLTRIIATIPLPPELAT